MDKRKKNGGHSTKSKKLTDRRKRFSVSDNKTVDVFFDEMKASTMYFYESIYSEIKAELTKDGLFYVYFHYLDGDLVYIGKGKDNRFKNWTSRNSKEHSELIRDGVVNCKIIANSLEESVALDIEDALIKKHKPKFNNCGQ
tara:strand:+ start:257 stop:679 length:423 start_codon:yes stop_codon:yes gene_type:complete